MSAIMYLIAQQPEDDLVDEARFLEGRLKNLRLWFVCVTKDNQRVPACRDVASAARMPLVGPLLESANS
jgi:hypothetical protein